MAAENIDNTTYHERMERIHAAIEYLKNLDPADLSPEDYAAIEDSIIRLYVRGQFVKALDDVLGPAISEFRVSVERASSLCREAMRHVDRAPTRPGAFGGSARSVTRKRQFSEFIVEES